MFVAGAALAHGGLDSAGVAQIEAHPFAQWSFDPLILGLAGLAAWLFVRGMLRMGEGVSPARRVMFLGGLGLVVLALQSPVDAMADHLFWMHQIQHMALRVLGPLFMLLAVPQGVIYAGMPAAMRRALLGPVVRSRGLRRFGHVLSRAVPATAVFVAVLWVWEYPPLHDTALLNEPLHYLMHVTMLAGGVLFFWVLFDPRDPPKAVSHRTRLMMLVVAVLAEILIGAVTTLKPMVLYPAYDITGRLYGMTALPDEVAGGFLIWSPTSMMLLLAVLFVVNRWNGAEERAWAREGRRRMSNSAALISPETAEELWMVVGPKNRRLGLALATIPPAMILVLIGTVETLRMV